MTLDTPDVAYLMIVSVSGIASAPFPGRAPRNDGGVGIIDSLPNPQNEGGVAIHLNQPESSTNERR